MSGFHTATICADCEPPVVAISTGYGCRCPKCGQVEDWSPDVRQFGARLDGALARKILTDTAIRSDGDARLLAELARRLLEHTGRGARIADLEAERDRMLPIYEAYLATERRAAEAREHEQQRVAALTPHELHREMRHPGYEYETTENARKSYADVKPPGEGWEPNDIVEWHLYENGVVVEERWRNWSRGDFTEINYWRRRT